MDQAGPPQLVHQDGQTGQHPLPNNYNSPLQQPAIPPIPFLPPQPVLPTPMAINWSYFKLEFSAKPKEDTGVHSLRTIDLKEACNYATDKRVRFPLILGCEAR